MYIDDFKVLNFFDLKATMASSHDRLVRKLLLTSYPHLNSLKEILLNGFFGKCFDQQISKHQPFDSQLSIIRQYVEMPFYVNCLYPNWNFEIFIVVTNQLKQNQKIFASSKSVVCSNRTSWSSQRVHLTE